MRTIDTILKRKTNSLLSILFLSLVFLLSNKIIAGDEIEVKGSIQVKTDSSITVNSLEFTVDGSTKIENEMHGTAAFADLSQGDYVKIEGQALPGSTLYAGEIILFNNTIDMELSGSISAITSNSLTVDGHEVMVDSNTVVVTQFHAGLDFGDLKIGDKVIVKTNQTAGVLSAVLIMVITENSYQEVEMDGKIEAITDGSIMVGHTLFVVSSRTVIVSRMDGVLEFGDLSVGQNVNVRGFQRSDSTYLALLIKVDGEKFMQKDLSLEGSISDIDSLSITVNGVKCFVNSNTVIFMNGGILLNITDLKAGDFVEVKSSLQNNGTYYAERIKLEKKNSAEEIELEGIIDAVSVDHISVGGYDIYVNSYTMIYSSNRQNLSIGDLSTGNFVFVKARMQDSVYTASYIKVRNDEKNSVGITGAIDAINSDTLTVRGVAFVTDQNTEVFDYNGNQAALIDLQTGQIVRIEGTVRSDGSNYAEQIKIVNFWRPAVIIRGKIESLGLNTIEVSGKLFFVDSTTVILGHGTGIISFVNLTLGMNVQINGKIDGNGELKAKLIKVIPERTLKLYGQIDSVGTSQFTVAGNVFVTDNNTVYYDEFDQTAAFDSLKTGQFVEVKFVKTNTDENLAVSVEIEKRRGYSECKGIVTSISHDRINLSVPSFVLDASTVFVGSDYTQIQSSSVSVGETVIVYASMDNNGTIKADQVQKVSGVVTAVKNEQDKSLPSTFKLLQNYPNPFNPETTITFTLNKPSKVVLKVFNAIGQEVTTLIDGEMETGLHYAIFNGNNLASGVYFYRLEAGGSTMVKKMMLLK